VPHEWDARTYDSLPLPHTGWGRRTLERLERLDLRDVRRVLDAGCGTGRDTELLLDLIPDVHVVAVDGSATMLAQLRTRLAGRLDRVEVVHADLTEPLPVEGPVDAVVSVAAFHWIADHDRLFRNLAAVLRPGGGLVTDCGGRGNIARVLTAIEAVLGESPEIWNFAGVEETERRLEEAGFTDLHVGLRADPARIEPGPQLESYLATVVLGAHLACLPEAERAGVVRAVAARLPEPIVDYVRLEIAARKGPL
jgi:trans-aconitate 2-methyltransferase